MNTKEDKENEEKKEKEGEWQNSPTVEEKKEETTLGEKNKGEKNNNGKGGGKGTKKIFASFRRTVDLSDIKNPLAFLSPSTPADRKVDEAIRQWVGKQIINTKELQVLDELRSRKKPTPRNDDDDDGDDDDDDDDGDLHPISNQINEEMKEEVKEEVKEEEEISGAGFHSLPLLSPSSIAKRSDRESGNDQNKEEMKKEKAAEEIDIAVANWMGHSATAKKEKKSRRKGSKGMVQTNAGESVAGGGGKIRKRKWAFVFANIGDCKIFLCSKASKQIIDITQSNRLESENAKDCGGRLGPYLPGSGAPDLRNLSLHYYTLYDGDILIILSDGVHDNLDPEMLGLSPIDIMSCLKEKELIEGVAGANQWADLDKLTRHRAKTAFRESQLATIIGNNFDISPTQINSLLMNYCRNITVRSRMFMEQNPFIELPEDYSLFPGKMDHSTCICFKVGEILSPSPLPSSAPSLSSLGGSSSSSSSSGTLHKLKRKLADSFVS